MPSSRRFSCLLRQLAEKLIKILLYDGQVLQGRGAAGQREKQQAETEAERI